MAAQNSNLHIYICTIALAASLNACSSGSSNSSAMAEQTPQMGAAQQGTESIPDAAIPTESGETQQTTQSAANPPSPAESQEPEALPEPEPLTAQIPPSVGCGASQSDIQNSTLYLINLARSEARMCGGQSYAAAPQLTWNSKLEAAAAVHANDMSVHNFFSHTGSDGSSSAQRASSQNYDWQTVGENIAAGQQTTASVMQAWLDSPGHCANIMNPGFKEVAVVCSEDSGSQYRYYWANVLGASL